MITGSEVADLTQLNGRVYVPSQAKIVKVTGDRYGSDLVLGNTDSALTALRLKTAGMKLFVRGSEASINDTWMSKLACLVSLIQEHGLREDVARSMLKEAEKYDGARFRIKYAYGMPMDFPGGFATMEGPGMPPSMPSQTMGMMNLPSGGVPMQTPDEQHLPVDTNYQPMQETSLQSMAYDPMTMQMAQSAGQTGRKEVFDTAMFSSLLKASNPDTVQEGDLGVFTDTMNRLGRRLLMFYWHNDEYADRYGKRSLPELEDTLRNSFEIMGDLILYLRNKTVELTPGGLSLGAAPNIDEAARN